MIDIIPKKVKKAPEWYSFGFYIALALLIAVVLAYALSFYFEGRALNNFQDLEDRIAQVGTKQEKAVETEVLAAKKRINDFSKLLQSHKKSSNFFTLLEENCHPEIWLTGVELYPEEAEAIVTGQTSDFQNLGQQLAIFREQDLIESLELTDLLIGEEGEAKFSLYFHLDPVIFHE